MRMECGLAETTIRNCLSNLRGVDAWLKIQGTTLERATYDELTAWVRATSARGLAASSITRTINTLRTYLTFSGKADLAKRLEVPRSVKQLPLVPSREEVARLIDSATPAVPRGTRDRAIMELLYATGLRASELAGLLISDLQPDALLVHGKGGKDRMVPVGAPARKAVAAYLATRPDAKPADRMFLSATGKPFRQYLLYRMLKRWGKVSKQRVPIHPHLLRRAFATHTSRYGASLHDIQQWMGHENINTTAVYLHIGISDLKRTVRDCLPRERMARGESGIMTANEMRRRKPA